MNKWVEISIHTTNEAVEAVANLLHEAGANGVVIQDSQDLEQEEWLEKHGQLYQLELDPEHYPDEGVLVKGYLPITSTLEETVEEIKTQVNNLLVHDINLGKGTVTLTEVKEEDWAHAWKKFYKPVQISDSITISPTWEQYTPQSAHEKVIELDPGMAFGTGTHPTTKLSIQAMEDHLQPRAQVIDVGCGSGVLSIAAMKLGAKKVFALDIDDVSVKVAKENIHINGLSSAITVQQNNLLDHIDEQADVVVANILAEVILRFIGDAHRVLKDGGVFITSGIIDKKKEEVRQALEEHQFSIEQTLEEEGWYAFVARKVSG